MNDKRKNKTNRKWWKDIDLQSDRDRIFKEYYDPKTGQTLRLTEEEFYRVVEVVRILARIDARLTAEKAQKSHPGKEPTNQAD